MSESFRSRAQNINFPGPAFQTVLVLALAPSLSPLQAQVVEKYQKNGCIACHTNAPGELSRAVEDWARSVHARNGVTCDGCHGGDPEIRGLPSDRSAVETAHFSAQGFIQRPKAAKVSYFCGKCHAAIKEKHLGSPHGENIQPTCIYCHGFHGVNSPTTMIIDPSRCTTCHDFRNAAQIRALLEGTEKDIQELGSLAGYLEEHRYKNLALEEMHHHSRSTVTQLRIAFHSFNLGEVTNFASQIRAVLEQTQRTVEIVKRKEEAKGIQTIIGICAAAFLTAFAVLLMRYKKRFLDRE